MNVPGFAAEYAVLDDRPFRGSTRSGRSLRRRGEVVPALPPGGNAHACFELCRGGAAYPGCMQECMGALGGGGGTGGGVGDPHCLVGCGPCLRLRGRSVRACVQPDCSVHYISCGGPA